MVSKAARVIRSVALIAKPAKYCTFISCLIGFFASTPIALVPAALPRLILFFLSFAVLTYTGLYLLNDIADIENDRRHPLKNGRALASGLLTESRAAWLSLALVLAGFALGYLVHPLLPAIEGGFVLLNVAYSWKLKHVPYADLLVNTITHPLRVVTGILLFGQLVVGQVPVILAPAALFLATGALKRHFEASRGDIETRPVLCHYSEAGLRSVSALMGFVLALLVVVEAGNPLYLGLIAPNVAIYLFSVGGYWRREGRWRNWVVYGLMH